MLGVLVLAPVVAGALAFQQTVVVDATSQTTFAPLSSGDRGVATIGASQAGASVVVTGLSIQTANDILDITSSDDSWQVHARYVSHTGFSGFSTSFTLSLREGTSAVNQVRIANGAATITSGSPVDLHTAHDTELFAQASTLALGSLQVQLILSQDDGVGPVLRYDVNVSVT